MTRCPKCGALGIMRPGYNETERSCLYCGCRIYKTAPEAPKPAPLAQHVCRRCGLLKPITAFHASAVKYERWVCRECWNKAEREYYAARRVSLPAGG